jgi:ribosomal protein S18 acetylase RimI-like enzyme
VSSGARLLRRIPSSTYNFVSAFRNPQLPAPQILPATETDLPAIARLAGIIWRSHYPGIISAEQIEYMLAKMYSLETLREEMRLRAIRYERLLAGQELAGFASHGPTEQPQVFKLHKIYLHPAWHGQGLGSMLLRHCALQARELGADRLMLTVNKRNSQAIAAYHRNGFAITDSVVVDIGGGFVMDDYVMAKELRAE